MTDNYPKLKALWSRWKGSKGAYAIDRDNLDGHINTAIGYVQNDLDTQKPLEGQELGESENVSLNKKNLSKEVPWNKNDPEYLLISKALDLHDAGMSLSKLSKMLTPDGPMRYMRAPSKKRCKVHLQDFFAVLVKAHHQRILRHI